MVKGSLKKIDLLRKRRDVDYLADPFFIDTKKYIKKGLISGITLLITTLILGFPFVLRFIFSGNFEIK